MDRSPANRLHFDAIATKPFRDPELANEAVYTTPDRTVFAVQLSNVVMFFLRTDERDASGVQRESRSRYAKDLFTAEGMIPELRAEMA